MPVDLRGKPLRILVIGCGSIGTRHIKNLLALQAGTVTVFDVQEERRKEASERFGVGVVSGLEEAWEQEPEAVLITTPTNLHVPLAIAAAEHGAHLFIEKPLSDRWDDALERLLSTVRERRLITLVGCNLRFQPGLAHVKRLLEDSAIGRVVAARVEAGQYLPDWHPWEDYRRTYSSQRDLGGGVILDAIHELDYLRWLLGDVEAVSCFAGKLSRLEIETEDTAAILLRFVSGAIGEVHCDYVQRAYSRGCQLIGDEGTIRWDYLSGETRWYAASRGGWETLTAPAGWEPSQMYVEEMRHFLKCVSGEEQPTVDVHEGARVLAVALAAKRSAQTGQIVELGSRRATAGRMLTAAG